MAQSEKQVSIITATYNAKATIEASIQSVISLKSESIEYIIIDGGSTDGTVDVLNTYLDYIDFFISEPDDGIYDALNKGIKRATGKHVLVLGADDELLNIDCALNYLNHNPDAGALIFDVESFDSKTGTVRPYKCRIPDRNNIEASYFDFPLHHQGFICKNHKELKFDKTLGLHADLQCMINNIMLFGSVKLNVTLSRYRTGGASDYVSIDNLISFHAVAKNLSISSFKAILYHPIKYLMLLVKVLLPKRITLIYREIKSNVLR